MNLLKTINLAVVTALFAACVSLTSYEPSDAFIRTVDRVLDRHDLYVQTDPSLDEEEAELFLFDSEIVRAMLDGVDLELDRALLLSELSPILARHDAFVLGDDGLDDVEKGIFLESSARIRSILTRED